MNIEQTLTERGERYGDFAEHARIAQGLKDIMWNEAGWSRLTPAMRQSLEVIADKIARILNGDPTYADNWHDIQGYAQLVEKTLFPVPVAPSVSVRDLAMNLVHLAWLKGGTSASMRRVLAVEYAGTNMAVRDYILENFGELDMELEAEETSNPAHVQD